jgi:hypothetical protein
MRKASFIPLSKKKDLTALAESKLTGQERIDRMFELIDSLIYLQKEFYYLDKPNSITLKRKNGGLS